MLADVRGLRDASHSGRGNSPADAEFNSVRRSHANEALPDIG